MLLVVGLGQRVSTNCAVDHLAASAGHWGIDSLSGGNGVRLVRGASGCA